MSANFNMPEVFADDMRELYRILTTNGDWVVDDEGNEGIELTIGVSYVEGTEEFDSWGYQTGDNSVTGGAYCHPHWLLVTLTSDMSQDDFLDQVSREYHSIFC